MANPPPPPRPPPEPPPMRAPPPPPMREPPPPPMSNKTTTSNPASINNYYNRPTGNRGGIGTLILIIIIFVIIAFFALFSHSSTSSTTTITSTVSGSGSSTVTSAGSSTVTSLGSTATTTINLGPNTYCAPAENYTCSSVSYNSIAKTLTVVVSQEAYYGYPWTSANITFVPSTASYKTINNTYEVPNVSFMAPNATSFTSVANGTNITVTAPIRNADIIGSYVNVTIWARYTVSSYPGYYYAEMANLSTPT